VYNRVRKCRQFWLPGEFLRASVCLERPVEERDQGLVATERERQVEGWRMIDAKWMNGEIPFIVLKVVIQSADLRVGAIMSS
jgi:hypothetical protein